MSQAAAPRSMFAIFRKRNFTLMWSAQLVSTIGSSLTDLAAGILIYRYTGSAFAVGLTLMVTAVPTLLVGLVAGVFVDRFDRKRILLASDLLRGLIVVTIPFGVATFGPLAIYALLFGGHKRPMTYRLPGFAPVSAEAGSGSIVLVKMES